MAANSELFQHLNFLLVVTNAEGLEAANITAQLLRSNGCNRCELHEQYLEHDLPNGEALRNWFVRKFGQDQMINFIISEDSNFPFYEIAAFDFLIPVVTSEWVSTCLSTNRHHRTSGFSPDERHIFKDLQIYVSRHAFNHSEYLFYTEMVHAMGGTCMDFLSSKTTHLVTQDADDPAVKAVLGFGKANCVNFVFPTWIVKSFKALDVAKLEDHLLDPEASSEISAEKLQDLWDGLDDMGFRKTSTILEGHGFVIGLDVSLNRNLYATLVEFLQANGGTVIRHIDEDDIKQSNADCYIGNSVMSKEYEVARDSGLELGNLIWIFFLWSYNQFISSKTKLIFAPFKKKLFDVNELILSYSNYYGQQRFYIQRLAELLGGYSTGELSRKNTHLVSQFPWGKKFETAKKWQTCTVVNHLWLETIYKSGKVLDPLESQFQQFPVAGGLQHVIGQIGPNEMLPQHRDVTRPEEITIMPADSPQKEDVKQPSNGSKKAGTEPPHIAAEDRTSSQLATAVTIDRCEATAIGEVKVVHKNVVAAETANVILGPAIVENEAEALLQNDAGRSVDHLEDQATQDPCAPEIENDVLTEGLSAPKPPYEELKEPTAESQLWGAESNEVPSDAMTEKTATPQPSEILSQPDRGRLGTPTSHENISRSGTPFESSMPSQTLHSSGGRRAAKAKAARKLHSDIELLNEFQRNSKRKRTGDLLPEEIAQLERRKLLEQKASEILRTIYAADESKSSEEVNRRRRSVYNMDAICTGCHDDIGELDKILLERVGIRVHEEITKENLSLLNTIIAPKRMRTAKFLKSFSFHPLRYALKPEFLTDLLQLIHRTQPLDCLSLNLTTYAIPEVDTQLLLQMTSLPTKVFERAGLSSVNLVNDIPGGVEVITSILKAHGIKEVRVVPTSRMNQLTINDLVINDTPDAEVCAEQIVPDCVMIAIKSSQVKHFKRVVKNHCTSAMAVEWNWCISSIFKLDAEYSDRSNIIFQQGQSNGKRSSK
ncbi:hypothetical protein HG536_0A01170 [Torulaspora globosa]|uniref:BRCT domain-containing protein n=1 Tax=Torulaspora globosa TaxID=48254 RepID=A0A7G3Z9W4_9SACH|nr:uncharacterized protein HG536_0A01170 [Torulaspora globosa]QLL30300.1 hypothetical protein HG536_0A01170 [Torulaspora globosa]